MKTTRSEDGTILAYDTYGEGPALIYITGATCFRSFGMVLNDAKTLAQEFTVYSYDRRGRGDSGNTLPYSIEREVEDIEAIIDAAGGTAFLYGHSSGAILALEATMRLGDKVKKLVMYDVSYVNDEATQAEFKKLGQWLNATLADGKNDQAIAGFLEGIGIPKEAIGWMQQSPDWPTMTALAPMLAYDTLLAGNLPPLQRASRITTPTKIIVGEKSPASIHGTGKQLNGAIPASEYVILDGEDHMPNPALVLPLLSSFLK